MARACARTRSPARPRKDQPLGPAAERTRDGAHACLVREPAAGEVRRGFLPSPEPTYQSACACSDVAIPIGPRNRRPLYPARPEKAPMTDRHASRYAAAPPADPLTARRVFFTAIVLASMVGLIWLLSFALSAGGFAALDLMLVVLFAVTLPWSVIGFWNATIGLFIMRSADPVAAVTPVSARVTGARADHGQDRDPVVRAQRGHRARHPQHRADDGRSSRPPTRRLNSMSSS